VDIKADDYFDDNEKEVEDDADDKGAVDLIEVNGVVVVAETMCVVVVVSMVVIMGVRMGIGGTVVIVRMVVVVIVRMRGSHKDIVD
jgi:hypothetical protein